MGVIGAGVASSGVASLVVLVVVVPLDPPALAPLPSEEVGSSPSVIVSAINSSVTRTPSTVLSSTDGFACRYFRFDESSGGALPLVMRRYARLSPC